MPPAIRCTAVVFGFGLLLALPASAQMDPHTDHSMSSASQAPASAKANPAIPAGEETARAQLDQSPRHGEWVDIRAQGVPVKTWVDYPERASKAPVVIVIHEIYGLSDWIRAVADQLAKDGYIALAPDLISGKGPGGGNTDSVGSRDDVVKLVTGLSRDEVVARLDAVRQYAVALPSANGKSATVGFCWGGSTSFAYATRQPALDAAVVYYGTAPTDEAVLGSIKGPVLGLYGGDDARVDATIDATKASMSKLGRSYEPVVFEGAGHGFLRQQNGRDGANMKATLKAWPKTLAFLQQNLK
jgi:carboxymethylenebutenolidase